MSCSKIHLIIKKVIYYFKKLTLIFRKIFVRMNECFSNKSLKIKKKVIYLDQFVFSNIAKSLKNNHEVDKYWQILYEKLHQLFKNNRIICPYSNVHQNESLLSKDYHIIQKIYSIFSNGVKFFSLDTIKRNQIIECAQNWIAGVPSQEIILDVHSIVNGNINSYIERFIISVDIFNNDTWIDNLKKIRDSIETDLLETFKQWQTEKNIDFHQRYEKERKAYGIEIIRQYELFLEKFDNYNEDISDEQVIDLIPSFPVIVLQQLKNLFIQAGFAEDKVYSKFVEYLLSETFIDVPFLKISALLYAALARSAASGRKNPPKRGLINDFDFISVLLPYCDVMFIDNECYNFLNENPTKELINYSTLLFSTKNKDEFIKYLDDLIR